MRGNDVVRIALVILVSSTCTMLVEIGLLHAVSEFAAPYSTLRFSIGAPWNSFVHRLFMIGWTIGDGVLAGYIAARVSRRAPVPAALALATTWIIAIAGVNLAGGQLGFAVSAPLWFKIANVGALLSGVVAGGLLRALRKRSL